MNNRHGDINDDEIRIISSGEVKSKEHPRRLLPILLCIVALLLSAVVIGVFFFSSGEVEEDDIHDGVPEEQSKATDVSVYNSHASTRSYTVNRDTVADGVALTILTPVNATPVLEVGNDIFSDSTIVLIAQAADIRGDTGGIVGAFVVNGELVSKGEAKAGFCSIINGEVTVGVADATPMLEQALMTNGYFFRQYPLVVGGQIVENKPKGKSKRRALVELDGRISVVISREKMSFHDFSQALIDIGIRNAIYLVGGGAYGRYVDAEGRSFTFGPEWDKEIDNVNYIVWR